MTATRQDREISLQRSFNALIGLVEMARPFDGIVIGSAVILGIVMATFSMPSWEATALALLMGLLLLGAMDTLNDIKDVTADAISKPWRPLPSGRVTRRMAFLAVIVEATSGMLIASFLGMSVLILVVLSICLAVAYSLWLKQFFFSKNVVVAFALSTAYLAGALASNRPLSRMTTEFWIIYGLIMLVAFCFEIHKDIADVEGDKATNVRTIPTVLGERAAVVLSSLGYAVAWIVSAIIISMNDLSLVQALFLSITAALGLVVVYWLLKNPVKTVERTRRIATVLIGLMIIALIDNQVKLL